MPNEVFESSVLAMDRILRHVENGEMQIPEFQREFVWAESKQKELIASIYKGYPIGSLLLMSVGSNQPLEYKAIKTFSSGNKKPKYLVLDGQQRVTTIAYTFSQKHQRQKIVFIDLRKLHEISKKSEPSLIDLAENEILRIEKIQNKKSHVETYAQFLEEDALLPCFTLFDSEKRSDLLVKLRDHLRKTPDESVFLRFLDRLDPYFERFSQYRLPSIIIHEDADLDVVATIFTQLNTQGQKLTAFDLCLAKYYKESNGKFQLRTFLDDLKKDDSSIGMVDDDGTSFLQSVALTAGVDPKKASLVKKLSYEHINKHKNSVIDSLRDTGTFFQDVFKCDKIEDIPYKTTIPPLSLIFQKHKNFTVSHRALIAERIKRWIIITALKNRYTEGTDLKTQEDVNQTIPYVLGDQSEPETFSDPWVIDADFIQSSSGSRMTLLIQLLKMNHSKDFISDNLSNEKHHIFPKKYLKTKKFDDKSINSILNLTLISKSTNASIGGNKPSVYISKEIIPTLQKTHKISSKEAEKKLRDIMRKHFIDDNAFKRLMGDDYTGFLKARARALGVHLKKNYNIEFQDISQE